MDRIKAIVIGYIINRIHIPAWKCIKLNAGKLYLNPKQANYYRNYLLNAMVMASNKLTFTQALGLSQQSLFKKILLLVRFLNPIRFILFLLCSFRSSGAVLVDAITKSMNRKSQQSHFFAKLFKALLSLTFIIEIPLAWLYGISLAKLLNKSQVKIDNHATTHYGLIIDLVTASQLEDQLDYQPSLKNRVQKLTAQAKKIKDTLLTLEQVSNRESAITYKKMQEDMQQIFAELTLIQRSHEDYASQQADLICAPCFNKTPTSKVLDYRGT